jgi:hypothetical protein
MKVAGGQYFYRHSEVSEIADQFIKIYDGCEGIKKISGNTF